MAPVRVLWLAKGLGRGGAERLLAQAIPHVDRSRFDVEVAYLLPWKDALVPEIEGYGTKVHCLRAGHAFDPRWVGRLRGLVKDGDYGIVHTHAPYPALGARLALARPGPILVHTEHNVWQRYRRLTGWANARTIERNAAVIAVSEAVAESIKARRDNAGQGAGPPVEVLVHGIDPARSIAKSADSSARARVILGLDEGEAVVGTVGNFTPKKDHLMLIAAFASLARAKPGVRLVLVGTGPLERTLRDSVQRHGLTARVTFAGSRDDVLEVLPAFDVFALSSLHEGLPIALLEAMAAGLPCVATRVGGVHEVVTDGQGGLLVPPGDPAGFATALATLLDDADLRARMGGLSRARVADLDAAPAVSRLQEIYEMVGQAHSSAMVSP